MLSPVRNMNVYEGWWFTVGLHSVFWRRSWLKGELNFYRLRLYNSNLQPVALQLF